MYIFWRFWYRITICWPEGHIWEYDGVTLGGDWVKCAVCNAKDEWLPGVHEPKGSYFPDA